MIHVHPIGALAWAKGWAIRDAIIWLEANGHLTGMPEQEEPFKLRQIPLQAVEDILMAADRPDLMPDCSPLEWVCYDDPESIGREARDAWRAGLPADDPRKDPEQYRQHLRNQNQHHQINEPDDRLPERYRDRHSIQSTM